MGNNKLLSWSALTLFALAVLLAVLLVLAPTFALFGIVSSDAALWVIGVLAVLSAILGLIAFKTPQGKIAAIGGVVLLFAVLWLIPIRVTISG